MEIVLSYPTIFLHTWMNLVHEVYFLLLWAILFIILVIFCFLESFFTAQAYYEYHYYIPVYLNFFFGSHIFFYLSLTSLISSLWFLHGVIYWMSA